MTQGEELASLLKARPYSYLEMQMLGISTSPQKRLVEWERRNPKWRIERTKRYIGEGEYLTQWRVVPSTSQANPYVRQPT